MVIDLEEAVKFYEKKERIVKVLIDIDMLFMLIRQTEKGLVKELHLLIDEIKKD